MGTSLRIPGFKKLVKEFSKCVASKGGVRVLVNREEIGGRSEWKGVFDYEGAFPPSLPFLGRAAANLY